MRQIDVLVDADVAGLLTEIEPKKKYRFQYLPSYTGPAISLTMPIRDEPYIYEGFPPYFDGLLPEGPQLDGLLRQQKLDRSDLLGQLRAVGRDLVGRTIIGDSIVEANE